MKNLEIFFLLACMQFLGCMAECIEIPNGNYISENTDESIEIEGDEIKFTLYIPQEGGKPYKYIKKCNYYVLKDSGFLTPYTLATTEYVLGLGRFNWFWVDGEIIKEDYRNGDAVHFKCKGVLGNGG